MVPDPLKLTQALIRCPSVTPYDAGAQDALIEVLEPLGFTAYDVTRKNIRNTFFRRGTEGPHFCFAGHTDVVPPGEEKSWTHAPFAGRIHEGFVYGRGAADMKGNIACFIAAMARYLDGHELKGSISLLITGDEEGDAKYGTVKVLEWMDENGHIPDAALVGEPTCPEALGDEIKIGRRGSLSGVVRVTGKQGHVAYPQLADNPVPRLVRLLHTLIEHKFDEGSAHFQPTNLELTSADTGNPADNVIPEISRGRFNVRFSDRWTAESLTAHIKGLLEETGLQHLLRTWSNAESFLTEPGPFSDLVSRAVEEVTGRKPALTTTGGTSDARFISPYCPVVECGLVNKTIHQTDECVAAEDLKKLTEIYRKVLEYYFTG